MGDIFRKVTIRGVRTDGERAGRATVYALLDSGASAGVITRALAKKARGTVIEKFDKVEGAMRDVMLAKYRAHVPDCGERGLSVIVSDALVERAGIGPDGKPVQMILGHDYMQRTRMVPLLSEKPADTWVVGCWDRGTSAPRSARQRRRYSSA